MNTTRDDDIKVEAIRIIGEFGSESEVAALVNTLHFSEAVSVRRSAACALANIGGPLAAFALKRMVDEPGDRERRVDCLCGLLDLATDGWESYQMNPVRVTLPLWLEQLIDRLNLDSEMQPIYDNVSQCFDRNV